MKKVVAMVTLLVLVVGMTVGSFAAQNGVRGNGNGKATALQGVLNMSMATAMEDVQNRAEVNGDKPSQAERAAFRTELASRFTALELLRAECKTNWETIKGMNESIKTRTIVLRDEMKALGKDAAKPVWESLAASTFEVRADIDEIRVSIRNLQKSKKAAWVTFKAAVKAKDLSAAQTALDSILSIKQQIAVKQKEMIPLKSALLAILNAFDVPAAPALEVV